jgi:hypothetical protein
LNSASQSEAEDETERDVSGDGDDEDDDDGTKDNHRDGSQATALTSKAHYIVSASITMHEAMNGTTKKHSFPMLARFAIFAAEADPDSTLLAIQKSLPRSMSSQSPDGVQSLPSLQTTLGQIVGTPIADTPNGTLSYSQDDPGRLPIVTRPQHMAANAGSSPIVPLGYPSHPSFWRGTSEEVSLAILVPASL